MAAALLDILDSDLCLYHDGRHVCSPGYALLEGDSYRFGDTARGSARRQPRYINTRFWWQLGTQSLQPSLGPARHTADLVHAHLLDVHRTAGEPDEVVLAVPDSLGRDQLALLLGIAQTCPFRVVGLINRSVLAAEAHGDTDHLFHLELQLHQALLTQLSVEGGQIRLVRSHALPGSGLLALQEAIVERVARSFIQNTRFDPRRKADTEQTLYDGLFQSLGALQTAGEIQVDISGYSTRINVEELASVADRLHDAITQETRSVPGPVLLLDPQACLIPGFGARFSDVRNLDKENLPAAFARHHEHILQPADDLHLLKGLPAGTGTAPRRQTAMADAPRPAPRRAESPPTHILHEARARPLGHSDIALTDHCRISREDPGCWVLAGDAKVRVNGAAYAGAPLETGDELSANGKSWLLIEVGDPA